MARGERICVVCGKKYIYCPSCKKGNPTETWRFEKCGEDCRKIFRACSDFRFGHMNAAQAQEYLQDVDTSDRSKFNEDIRMNLSAIYADKAEEKKEESKEEEKPVEQPTEEEKAEDDTPAPEPDAAVELPIKPAEPKEDNNSFRRYNNKRHTKFVKN